MARQKGEKNEPDKQKGGRKKKMNHKKKSNTKVQDDRNVTVKRDFKTNGGSAMHTDSQVVAKVRA